MEIGERIAQLRKSRNLSQEELAEKLLVSRQIVSLWESGKSLPSTDNIKALCAFFDVSADFLINGKEAEDSGKKAEPDKSRKHLWLDWLLLVLGVLCIVIAIPLVILYPASGDNAPTSVLTFNAYDAIIVLGLLFVILAVVLLVLKNHQRKI
jgi:transcriptional regulator with XRE-family HTH domain